MTMLNALPFVIGVLIITKAGVYFVCHVAKAFRQKGKKANDAYESDSIERKSSKQVASKLVRQDIREFDEMIRKLWHQQGDNNHVADDSNITGQDGDGDNAGDGVVDGEHDGDGNGVSDGASDCEGQMIVTKLLSAIDRGLSDRRRVAADVLLSMHNEILAEMRTRSAETSVASTVELAGPSEIAADAVLEVVEKDLASKKWLLDAVELAEPTAIAADVLLELVGNELASQRWMLSADDSLVVDIAFLNKQEMLADSIQEVVKLEPSGPTETSNTTGDDVGCNETVEIAEIVEIVEIVEIMVC